jgi:DNA-binding MarR family transcriptional regulator
MHRGGPGLAFWDHDQEQKISDEKIAALWAVPGYADACRMSNRLAQELVKNDAVFHANFRDTGRMVLGTIALYLHASGGLTHRRLCELSSGGGRLSPGRASAILLRLRMIGYVKAAAKRSDGSARLYLPTERMIGAFCTRVEIELQALTRIEPQMHAFIAVWEQDRETALMALYRRIGKRLIYALSHPREDMKPYEALLMRDAGLLIFHALMEAADTGSDFPNAGRFTISLTEIARRFGVSRTHVLRFMRDAERAGFLARDGNGNLSRITPSLCKAYATYSSILQIAWMATAFHTLQELEGQMAA